jgi:hypothetical protein
MTLSAPSAPQGDGRLWVIALGLSLLVNVGILGILGFTSLRSQVFQKTRPISPPVAEEASVVIFPDLVAATSSHEPAAAAAAQPAFARTSADQTAAAPEKAAWIGERNTQATSDRRPDATAPPLPSQAGIEPKDRQNLETTENNYQDGKLGNDPPAKPQDLLASQAPPPDLTPDPALADSPAAGEKMQAPGKDDSKSPPSARESLLEGPNPVDVPVPQNAEEKAATKPSLPKRPKDGNPAPKPADLPKPAVPKSSADPGFRGFQRKTAIVGSISRTGRSALNVVDSPLGRYQAVISRAVEQEWQRNCVRHRDFITPGFLTVRFFVEASGRVRTVQFVGDMETGEVQKGFTLNAIRDAEIPAMPAALKKDFAKEPLELIFNFYF